MLRTGGRDQHKKTNWAVSTFPYEVGDCGFVAKSTYCLLKKLGVSGSSRSKLAQNLGSVSARCSYAIYLRRSTAAWDRTRALLLPLTPQNKVNEVSIVPDARKPSDVVPKLTNEDSLKAVSLHPSKRQQALDFLAQVGDANDNPLPSIDVDLFVIEEDSEYD